MHTAFLKVGVSAKVLRKRGKNWTSGSRDMTPLVKGRLPWNFVILQQNRSALELIMHYARRVKVRTFSYSKEHGGTYFFKGLIGYKVSTCFCV